MTSFIAREKELRILRELSPLPESTLVALYGRRRVGKSSLVFEAFKNETIYSFEGIENRPKREQLANFKVQFQEYWPGADLSGVKSWYTAFTALFERIKHKGGVVLFDEFQWMANYRPPIVAELKAAWDRHYAQSRGIVIVLCGSVASFMVNKVVRSKAIYGRIHTTIHLKPFKLKETREYLSDRSLEEVLQVQMLVGGIPGYLKRLRPKGSVYLAIQELAFQEHGYFTSEFERIFVSQFGRSAIYEKVIRRLAKSTEGLSRVELVTPGTINDGKQLSTCLKDLEIAGLITAAASFHTLPKGKEKLYRLTDPYCRFYLSFIEPELSHILAGKERVFIGMINSPRFHSWLGYGFENLCLEHRFELAKLMGFSDVDFRVGPYFSRRRSHTKGIQIDLIYDRKDSVMLVCEIKFSDTPAGIEVVNKLKRNASLIPNPRNKTLRFALITKVPPARSVQDQAFFSHVILANQLADTR